MRGDPASGFIFPWARFVVNRAGGLATARRSLASKRLRGLRSPPPQTQTLTTCSANFEILTVASEAKKPDPIEISDPTDQIRLLVVERGETAASSGSSGSMLSSMFSVLLKAHVESADGVLSQGPSSSQARRRRSRPMRFNRSAGVTGIR